MERDLILRLLRERIVSFVASRYQKDVAEDVAQDVLRILYEKYPQVTALSDLIPLSLQIARYRLLATFRSQHRHGETSAISVDDLPLASAQPTPQQSLERKQQLQQLQNAILQLPDRCRQLIRLKLQGLPFPDIQKAFGIASINTIYTWDLRCRRQLQQLLHPDSGDHQ